MEGLVTSLFDGQYHGKRILLTGHTGFKGSWLSIWLKMLGADVMGYALPANTSPAHIQLLDAPEQTLGDLRDFQGLLACIQAFQPDVIFHLAAQALVIDAYEDPIFTFGTNVMGTLHVLEAAKKTASVKAVINITTDKVYDNQEWHWPYRETDRLGGRDPYSASKACVEIMSAAFDKSFYQQKHEAKRILLANVRAGNVVGGGDWATNRLIPDIVKASVVGKPVDIRNPEAVRPWQHVLDPLAAYLYIGQLLLQGKQHIAQSWNIGPETESTVSVRKVLTYFQEEWAEVKANFPEKISNAYHEATLLKLDCSKAKAELGWQPVWDIHQTIKATAAWYKAYYKNNEVITGQQIQQFINNAREKYLPWV